MFDSKEMGNVDLMAGRSVEQMAMSLNPGSALTNCVTLVKQFILFCLGWPGTY